MPYQTARQAKLAALEAAESALTARLADAPSLLAAVEKAAADLVAEVHGDLVPAVPRPKPAAAAVRLPTLRTLSLTLNALAVAAAVLYGAWNHLPRPAPTPAPVPVPAPPAPPAPVMPPRVLFAYESSDPLTREQLDALNSTAVREYLSGHCLKDPDGRPAWRFWDKDVDASAESDAWRKAWAAAKLKLGPLPQIVVIRGDKVEAVAMPATEAATLELLKQYGGP